MQPRDLTNVRGKYDGMPNAKSTLCDSIRYTKGFSNETSRTSRQVRTAIYSQEKSSGTLYLKIGVATLMDVSVT